MALGGLKIVEKKAVPAPGTGGTLAQAVAAAAHNVHNLVGAGLEPRVYADCLMVELTQSNIRAARAVKFSFIYSGEKIDTAFTADLVVDDKIIVLVKCEPKMQKHRTELSTCLRVSEKREGLLINFGVADMREGIMHAAVKATANDMKDGE